MSELNFTKLADAPILEEVPDGAKVYAEVDGKVYRVAGDNLGGMGVDTVKIDIQNDGELKVTCSMTFAEAKAILVEQKPLIAIVCYNTGVAVQEMTLLAYTDGDEDDNMIIILISEGTLRWHKDGSFDTGAPS